MESKIKERKRTHMERDRGWERTERKKPIFLLEWSRNTMLCLMDTLTVKDTAKRGEGQLKFSFKFCYFKCLAPEVRLNSLIWKSFRALLPQGNEMWLTVVYEPETCSRLLVVRVELKPQIVGSAGKGQTLHQRARVCAKQWRCPIFTVIQLIGDRKEHEGVFCCFD